MLVHRTVTPQQYVADIHLYTWVERDNVGQIILSMETTRWPGLDVEPSLFWKRGFLKSLSLFSKTIVRQYWSFKLEYEI